MFCAVVSLGAALWGQRSAALARRGANAIRRWYAWLHTHADAVCISTSVVVALGFRASIMFRAPAFVIGDSGAYVEAAETIRTAFSFAPLSYISPPGYSTFIAGVQILLGPDFLAVVAVQHLLGIGTVLLTYAVGRAFLPPLLAFLPALGTAANGYLLMIEHGIYSEALFIPLAMLFVLLTVRMLHGGRRGNASAAQSSGNLWRGSGLPIAAAAGATLGLAALTRLVIQPALIAVCLLLLVYEGAHRYRTWLRILTFVAIFGIVVSPWLVHNWLGTAISASATTRGTSSCDSGRKKGPIRGPTAMSAIPTCGRCLRCYRRKTRTSRIGRRGSKSGRSLAPKLRQL